MLTIGPTTAVYMDARLKAIRPDQDSPLGPLTFLVYDLTIPGTATYGGSLDLFTFAKPDQFTVGNTAHVTLAFGEPKPVLVPTGKLHIGCDPDRAFCRVYPEAGDFAAALGDCPFCRLPTMR